MATGLKKDKGKVAGRIPKDKRATSPETALQAAVASQFIEMMNTDHVQSVINAWVAHGKVVANIIDGRTVYYVPN